LKVFIDASLIIYLNVPLEDNEAAIVEEFWLNLVRKHELYVNPLVLEEAIYVSMKKYGINPTNTIKLIDKVVLPYADVLPLRLEEYLTSKKFIIEYGLKPSDPLHVATLILNKLDAIASEDKDFDKVGIKRIWTETSPQSRGTS